MIPFKLQMLLCDNAVNVFESRVTDICSTDTDTMHVHKAVHKHLFYHLLETFHPPQLRINILRTESGIKEDMFFISLEDGSLYFCLWNRNATILLMTR